MLNSFVTIKDTLSFYRIQVAVKFHSYIFSIPMGFLSYKSKEPQYVAEDEHMFLTWQFLKNIDITRVYANAWFWLILQASLAWEKDKWNHFHFLIQWKSKVGLRRPPVVLMLLWHPPSSCCIKARVKFHVDVCIYSLVLYIIPQPQECNGSEASLLCRTFGISA
jgi:hypothetical protein